MLYYQLPNKHEWYKDIIAESARRNISMRVVCELAGVKYDSLRYSARKVKQTGGGISYETLMCLTDALNGIHGDPKGGSDEPEAGW